MGSKLKTLRKEITMKPNTKVIWVLDIPEETHSKFKALAARKRKSMNQLMIELMEMALRTNRLTIEELHAQFKMLAARRFKL